MAKKSYSEKLRDPRWQKKRLEILERDGWTCQRCGDNESTLHVHHKRYIYGKEPWDYLANDLVTLCEDCHQDEFEMEKEAKEILLEVLRIQGWWADEIHSLACDLAAYGGTQPLIEPEKYALSWNLRRLGAKKDFEEAYFEHLKKARKNQESNHGG